MFSGPSFVRYTNRPFGYRSRCTKRLSVQCIAHRHSAASTRSLASSVGRCGDQQSPARRDAMGVIEGVSVAPSSGSGATAPRPTRGHIFKLMVLITEQVSRDDLLAGHAVCYNVARCVVCVSAAVNAMGIKNNNNNNNNNAFPWICKQEMWFLSTTPWSQSKPPL